MPYLALFRPSLPKGFLVTLVIVALVLGGICLFVAKVPVTTDEQPLNESNPEEFIEIASGESMEFQVEMPQLDLRGVVLYVFMPEVNDVIGLTYTNQRAAQTFTTYTYTAKVRENTARIYVPFHGGTLEAHDYISFKISRISGEPLKLKASSTTIPAIAALTPQYLPSWALNGLLSALIVVFAILLLYLVRLEKYRWWGAAILVGVLPIMVLNGLWFSLGEWGVADWDYRFSLHHIYRETVLKYHQFPFWNPYICGGTAGIGDPEFAGLSPTFLLELLFGVPNGTKLSIYLGAAILSIGVLRLAKKIGLSWLGAVLAAVITTYSSAYILKIAEGHVTIIYAFMWVPWIFSAWLSALKSTPTHSRGWWETWLGNPYVQLCAFFLALAFLQGGIYIVLYTILALGLLTCVAARPWPSLKITLGVGVWFVGFSAIKLLPNLYWLKYFRDEHYTPSATILSNLADIFFHRYLHGVYVIPNQLSGWHEYGAYVGYLVLGVALIGVSQIFKNRATRILLLGCAATITLSSFGPLIADQLDFLKILPRSNISRVLLYAVLCIGLLSGIGVDVLRRRFSSFHWLPVIVVGGIAIDIFTLASAIAAQAFTMQPVMPLPPHAPTPLAYTTRSFSIERDGHELNRGYASTLAGYGTFSFCSVIGPRAAVAVADDKNIPPFAQASGGELAPVISDWSPNGFTVETNLTAPGPVVINMNYAPGWKASTSIVHNEGGRMAATVASGPQITRFTYWPPLFTLGACVTVLTILMVMYRKKRYGNWAD